jgi:hypothetical protein
MNIFLRSPIRQILQLIMYMFKALQYDVHIQGKLITFFKACYHGQGVWKGQLA